MLYAVKFEFDTESSKRSRFKTLVYRELMDAAGVFNTLSLAYALAKPLIVKGGRSIDVLGAWLYEVDTQDRSKVVAAVEAGTAQLIDFAPELAVDIDDPTDDNWA